MDAHVAYVASMVTDAPTYPVAPNNPQPDYLPSFH